MSGLCQFWIFTCLGVLSQYHFGSLGLWFFAGSFFLVWKRKVLLIAFGLGVFVATLSLLESDRALVLTRNPSSSYEYVYAWPKERETAQAWTWVKAPSQLVDQLKQALFYGEAGALESKHWRLFGSLGLSHLFVISGLHLAGLYFLIRHLSRRFGPKVSCGISSGFAIWGLCFWGPSVSTWRATVFLLFTDLLSLIFPRLHRYRRSDLLALMGVLHILLAPRAILSPGYCFSYAATWLLLRLSEGKIKGSVFWVSSFVWALGFLFGGGMLASSPLINMVFVPIFIYLIFPALIVSEASETVSNLLNSFLDSLVSFFHIAQIGLLKIDGLFGSLLVLSLFYLLYRLREIRLAPAFAVFFVFIHFASKPEDLKLHAIDIGQGDALVVQQKDMEVGIDGGGPGGLRKTLVPKLSQLISGKLDLWVLSHFDRDHTMNFLNLYPMRRPVELWFPRLDPSAVSRRIQGMLGVKQFSLNSEARERCFHAVCLRSAVSRSSSPFRSVVNADSLVTELYEPNSGGLLGFFTGDLPQGGERRWSKEGGSKKTLLLKAGHHGSKTSSSRELLEQIRPATAIINCGRGNHYDFPHQEVLERLERWGVEIFRTDALGSFYVNIDF